jgi:hypothetical protein
MKKLLTVLLLLTACGQAQQPVADPVIVNVPVAVPCGAEGIPDPEWNLARLAADAGPVEKLKAVLADLELSRGYIGELKAELGACG